MSVASILEASRYRKAPTSKSRSRPRGWRFSGRPCCAATRPVDSLFRNLRCATGSPLEVYVPT